MTTKGGIYEVTIEDIRGQELVKIYKEKELLEKYMQILESNGLAKDNIYTHIKMYLGTQYFKDEKVLLCCYYSIDRDLKISINDGAVKTRIDRLYICRNYEKINLQ